MATYFCSHVCSYACMYIDIYLDSSQTSGSALEPFKTLDFTHVIEDALQCHFTSTLNGIPSDCRFSNISEDYEFMTITYIKRWASALDLKRFLPRLHEWLFIPVNLA